MLNPGERNQEVPIIKRVRKTANSTESVLAWTAEETGITAENESTYTQSKTILNTLELNVELTEREWKFSADGACEDELQSENDIGSLK